MKPVVPPKNQNPFRGIFRQLSKASEEDLKKGIDSARFLFRGMGR
jgi:hypothetical protein